MSTKVNRHKAIRELVQKKKISTQNKLTEELRKLGFKVTQSTISRDIVELKLNKIRINSEVSIYALEEESKLGRLFRDLVISIERAGNLIVIKTAPGSAQGIASAIDSYGVNGILGTVAGDDTILAIAKTENIGSRIVAKLKKFEFH